MCVLTVKNLRHNTDFRKKNLSMSKIGQMANHKGHEGCCIRILSCLRSKNLTALSVRNVRSVKSLPYCPATGSGHFCENNFLKICQEKNNNTRSEIFNQNLPQFPQRFCAIGAVFGQGLGVRRFPNKLRYQIWFAPGQIENSPCKLLNT